MVVTRRAAAAMKNNSKPEKTNDTIPTITRKRATKIKKAQSPPPPPPPVDSPSPQPEEESDQDDDLKNTSTIKSIPEPVIENGSDQAGYSSDSHSSSDENDIDSESEANDNGNDSSSGEEDSGSSEDDDDEQQEASSEDEDQDDDDNDDDLDDLLNKAQTALRKQQDGVIKLDADNEKSLNLQFPKLQPGVSVDDELYIKANKTGIAKLAPQAVAVIDSDDSASKNTKTLVALTKIKQDIKPPSRKERQLERAKTSGKGWFDMPLADVTPEIKRDLQILRMRHVLDRKRHYKKMGKGPDPKYFQMGTVIEGATEFFSSRINKKDRKRTFAEEILSQGDYTDYYYRKYQESQERKSSGGKKHFKKLKAKRS